MAYDKGKIVQQDDAEAAIWVRKSAEHDIRASQLDLGNRYYSGKGVPQDDVQAYKWLTLAAARFTASEKAWREKAIKIRELAAARMTAEQIADAERLAGEWKPK